MRCRGALANQKRNDATKIHTQTTRRIAETQSKQQHWLCKCKMYQKSTCSSTECAHVCHSAASAFMQLHVNSLSCRFTATKRPQNSRKKHKNTLTIHICSTPTAQHTTATDASSAAHLMQQKVDPKTTFRHRILTEALSVVRERKALQHNESLPVHQTWWFSQALFKKSKWRYKNKKFTTHDLLQFKQ